LGTRLWLDTGDLEGASERWSSEFEGLTTNNTLLNREVQKGIYDDLIDEVASSSDVIQDLDEHQRVMELALLLNARHGLKLVDRFDAWVSVELHTDLAHDLDATFWYGRRLFDICPDRFIVKVPLTAPGYLAARRLSRHGVRVNFTLGFSARQNYLAAVLARPAYVNVFLGRLNSFVAGNDLGDGKNVGERTLVASQAAVSDLRESEGVPTRQIAASMRDGGQVAALAGTDVMTLPLAVADGFVAEHTPDDALASFEDQTYAVSVKPGEASELIEGLWTVTEGFKQAVSRLMDEPLQSYGPDDLRAFFHEHGVPGVFPSWSEEDVTTIASDGKIPVYDHWSERLHDGSVALDALMSRSGLEQFAADQSALDSRIRSLL
jgi:transaldolase